MSRKFIWFTAMIAVCSIAVWAGVNPQKGKVKGDVGKGKADVGKVKDARVKTTSSSNCTTPRPKNRGCSIPCKPCQIAVCDNGKWVYEKVDWPKEECQPRPNPGGGNVCTIGISDPCPPECKSCVRR